VGVSPFPTRASDWTVHTLAVGVDRRATDRRGGTAGPRANAVWRGGPYCGRIAMWGHELKASTLIVNPTILRAPCASPDLLEVCLRRGGPYCSSIAMWGHELKASTLAGWPILQPYRNVGP
jgi:hypothetical protein